MIKSYLKDEDGIIHINPFICPECGSKDDTYTAYQLLIDKVKLDDPWYTEFEFINCMSCRRSIPGTLGYRYGEECKNYDDAKKIWKEKFKHLLYEWLDNYKLR